MVDAALLIPNPQNPNQHPKKQIELLAKIIKAQGWRAPVTVSNRSGFVVRGHGRLQAALLLGCMVPVDRQDYESQAAEWADLIADNRIAELASIDNELLAQMLAEINDSGIDFDMELTAYTDKQLDNVLADIRSEAVQEDNFDTDAAAAEAADNLKTACGDIWQLGKHRLMCGDSTSQNDIDCLMAGQKAAMIFTDPPYNVNYQGGTEDKLKIKNDNMPTKVFNNFLKSAFECMYAAVIPGAAVYVCHADSAGSNFRAALEQAGWSIRQCLVWVKNQFVLGRQDYQWQHEPILYGWRPDGSHRFFGGRKQGTVIDDDNNVVIQDDGDNKLINITIETEQLVIRAKEAEIISKADDRLMTTWRFEKPSRNGEHPTMKPIQLCARAIQNSSQPHEIVLDCFGGSGSTLMAAEQTGRICYCMELDPVYVDVIIKRWENYTGQQAICINNIT